ncbi:MAG: leucine-rich repeat domain-containing protein [Patescibacteria group bacterium]
MKNTIIFVLVVVVLGGVGYLLKGEYVDTPEVAEQKAIGGTLDMSGKGLTKVPSYVFEAREIAVLDLSNNALSGSLPAEVRQLQNLKVLDLSNNVFTGVPAEIGQLVNLEVLDLSNNKITGLPNELGNLSKLTTLDLSGNLYSEMDLAGIRARLPASTVIKTQ